MGHINFGNLIKVNKKESVREMLEIINPANAVCKQFQHGNQIKVEFNTKECATTKPLEIIHPDLCGPMRTKDIEGEPYFMLLVDDYTRMTSVCFLKKKSEAFEHFIIFKAMVENETELKIKTLRSNNGSELT